MSPSTLHPLKEATKRGEREVATMVMLANGKGGFFGFLLFMYIIQHCFMCRPSDSTLSEGAEIKTQHCCNIGSQTL